MKTQKNRGITPDKVILPSAPDPCNLRACRLVSQDNGLGYFFHGFAGVHAHLLDFAEGFALVHTLAVHENPLGSLNHLAGFQSILQILHFLMNGFKLAKARERHLNSGHQIGFSKRFNQITNHAGFFGFINQFFLAEGGQQYNRGNLLFC